MSQRWYVAETKPKAERQAAVHLRRQNFDAWLPTMWGTTRRSDGQRLPSVVPVFPAYVFVCCDINNERWRSINGTRGVQRLIAANDRPLPLPQQGKGSFDDLHARFGDEPVQPKELDAALRPLLPGTEVWTELQGIRFGATVLWSTVQRVRVLFAIFGRQTEVELDRDCVEVA